MKPINTRFQIKVLTKTEVSTGYSQKSQDGDHNTAIEVEAVGGN